MQNPISINQISKSFGTATVLNQVSLEVKANEMFGFIGLNGVGKTTLIKIILDLLDADSGNVTLFGVNSVIPKARSQVCYLPEKFQPSPYLTGWEFLKFAAGFYHNDLSIEAAEKLASRLSLDPSALKKRIGKYSKGMVQKLGLISVFLSKAELVILDEPMSGLDPKSRISLKEELVNYQKSGKTIFFSSHILSDIDEICDSIAVLNNGLVTHFASPALLKSKHSEQNLEKAFLKEIQA